MTSTTCARNLPQHFNGCTCAATPGVMTAEINDVSLTGGGISDNAPINSLDVSNLPASAKTYTAAPDPTDPDFPGRSPLDADPYAPVEYVTPKIAKRIGIDGPKAVDPTWHERWEGETQWADGGLPVMEQTPDGPRPLNPAGRTGLTGLGGCKRLGENKAADPVITRTDPKTLKRQMLLAFKETEQQWCLPGGTVDEGESAAEACSRELEEEVGLSVDMSQGKVLYRGYVDDHRNTDNAWFSTEARHVHLSGEAAYQKPAASDDVSAAKWVDIDSIRPEDLYASHGHIVAPILAAERPTTLRELGALIKQDAKDGAARGAARGQRDADAVVDSTANALRRIGRLFRRR